MINDFNEIRNEKDRELYAQCREIFDSWFLDAIKVHDKSKDHFVHQCWETKVVISVAEIGREIVKLTKKGMEPEEAIKNLIANNQDELDTNFVIMMAALKLKEQLIKTRAKN